MQRINTYERTASVVLLDRDGIPDSGMLSDHVASTVLMSWALSTYEAMGLGARQ